MPMESLLGYQMQADHPLSLFLDIPDDGRGQCVHGVAQPKQHVDRWRLPIVFQHRNVGPVDLSAIRQLFLCQSRCFTGST